MLQNILTNPLWTTLMMSLFPFWTRIDHTYIFNGGAESCRTKSNFGRGFITILNFVQKMN